jgi:hypothetical protein
MTGTHDTSDTKKTAASGSLSAEAVRARAFQLWVRGGKRSGHELEDWLEAERQLRAEAAPAAAKLEAATLAAAPAAGAKKRRPRKSKSATTPKPAKSRKRKSGK